MNWSDASAICRLEWRRSRWLPVVLCLLAGAEIAALWLSALPHDACIGGTVAVVACAGWMLRRGSQRPGCMLTWPGGDADWQIECDGRMESLRHVDAVFRGTLVVLTLADANGRRRRHVWWADTLDASGRRALRLATRIPKAATSLQPKLAG